jgi:hypothetical protein
MKPDRYRKMVEATFATPCRTRQEVSDRVEALLRREHKAIRTMVNNQIPDKAWHPALSLAYGQAIIDILDQLDKRRR